MNYLEMLPIKEEKPVNEVTAQNTKRNLKKSQESRNSPVNLPLELEFPKPSYDEDY